MKAAFPLHIPTAMKGDASETNEGMTLREYFAAHAPTEIPTWFVHVEPTRNYPPMPDINEVSREADDVHRKIALDWQHDPCFELEDHTPELKWYSDEVKAHRAGREAWREQDIRARYFQWRYAYADGMLEFGGAS